MFRDKQEVETVLLQEVEGRCERRRLSTTVCLLHLLLPPNTAQILVPERMRRAGHEGDGHKSVVYRIYIYNHLLIFYIKIFFPLKFSGLDRVKFTFAKNCTN